MPFMNEGICCVGYPASLRWIEEAFDRLSRIRQTRLERDVMLVSFQNIVVPAADQDLACPGSGCIEMTRGNAFRIDRASLPPGKEPLIDLDKLDLGRIKCFVPDRQSFDHP